MFSEKQLTIDAVLLYKGALKLSCGLRADDVARAGALLIANAFSNAEADEREALCDTLCVQLKERLASFKTRGA